MTTTAHNTNTLAPIEADCLAGLAGIRHGFYSRAGGVSEGIYASLNCGLGSDDDRDAVRANRIRVAQHLQSDQADVLTAYQVHSANAVVADGAIAQDQRPKADAIVTRTPGLAIGILTADCAPVLLAEHDAKIVAAAHAGWRGAVGGIVQATIQAMLRLGAQRDRIRAAIGPCISQAHYEVGPEFEDDFLRRDPSNARFFMRRSTDSKPHFDLPTYTAYQLQNEHIATTEIVEHCTYASESMFFSFRRATHRFEPDYGRQISAIIVT